MTSIRAASMLEAERDSAEWVFVDLGFANKLREVLWTGGGPMGRVVAPQELALNPGDHIASAFRVAGMDFGIPPVVVVGG